MRSNKSIIRTTTAALAIGIGLAAFGGTALANPGYHPQGGWQQQGHQQGHQQGQQHGQQNHWQRQRSQQQQNYQQSRNYQHQRNYQQSQYNGHQDQNGWQHHGNYQNNRYGGAQTDNGPQHQRWSQPHYNREGYHVTGTQGYYAPSAFAFSINLPLAGGQYGH